ncbi:YafY family protein [Uliginosibacterium sp. 31-16]|uniref:helix-turn-helix transcriptional regulator n=1 Tax=Uliginosibacterium sp. 31-16 TaxID=3068315 RepID=UPI00273D98F6|nr:YafY family protein [Uliginosibacterium sp. 31-16]MDP5239261.1 YafY family protein [Uliginosibacterium sp. 31-16]
MRRADRLFRLVELLRARRHATGAWLAEQLQVSLRTLYRDIHDLTLSGVPIEGEAGVGYRLRYRLDVPPLLFNPEELEALLVGSRMVQAWGDGELAAAAGAALAKIHNVLPEPLKREAQLARLFIPPGGQERLPWLQPLRVAVRERRMVRIDYVREDKTPSERILWPLGLFFWGRAWTLIGWCDLRGDFRHFRVDRIQQLDALDALFPDQPGRRLGDFFDQLERREGIRVKRE